MTFWNDPNAAPAALTPATAQTPPARTEYLNGVAAGLVCLLLSCMTARLRAGAEAPTRPACPTPEPCGDWTADDILAREA